MEFSFLGKRTRYLRYGSIPTITIVCDERLHSCWREHWESFPSGRRALISQSMMHIVYTTAPPFAVSWVQVVTCIHGWCIYLSTHRIKKYILLSHCWNPAVDTGLLLHEVGHIWEGRVKIFEAEKEWTTGGSNAWPLACEASATTTELDALMLILQKVVMIADVTWIYWI